MSLKAHFRNKNFIAFIFFILASFIFFEIIFFENFFARGQALYEKKDIYKASFYIFVNIIGFISIVSFLFIKNKTIYFSFFFLVLLTYILDLVYKNINGVGLTLNDLSVMELEGKGLFFQAISTFRESIFYALTVLLFFSIFIFILRWVINKYQYFINLKWILLLYSIALIFSFTIFYKTAGSTYTRPADFKVLNTIIYHYSNRLYYGKRQELNNIPSSPSIYKNIILIIDESIGAEYLSINGYKKETTPYLKSIQDSFINLGIASSGANCSSSSNLILMSGLQLNELPDITNISLKKQSIFQYAKNAGYKTHYLNGQVFSSGFSNYMNEFDLKYIDDFYIPKKFEFKSMPEEDLILKTKEILDSPEQNFIFMVKHGSHFSWENNYPKSKKYFEPTLGVNEPLTLNKKNESINSYSNSIRYSVDEFFKYFLSEINFNQNQNTLIIYTSDHGQSILEENRKSTHCDSNNPPLTQGEVPLLLFSNNAESIINNFKFQSNIYSHFQIFPTLQQLMGYKNLKGETLFDINESNFNQKFVSGNIFGPQMEINDLRKK
jgi:glucan phosphoethanolaminetransferase (alkaline phosphatase superfamily)